MYENFQGTCRNEVISFREQLINELERVVSSLLHDLVEKGDAVFSFTNRKEWSNIEYDEDIGVHRMKEDGKETHIRFNTITSMNTFGTLLCLSP